MRRVASVTSAYRVPRRFIAPPPDPPPYGLVALSLLLHLAALAGAALLSSHLSARLEESRVYIVNLVPAPPAGGAPAASAVAPSAPPARAGAPRPPAPPRAPEPRRTPDVAPARVQPPPDLPPPRPAAREREVARVVRALPPDELALPRRAERELPPAGPAPAREREVPRPLPPPPLTPPPPRPVELPRLTAPPSLPAPLPLAPPRVGPELVRAGRPEVTTSTSSVGLDASDFPFTYYLRQLHAKVKERWAPPPLTGRPERTVVLFEIGRDGEIAAPRIEHSSGNPLYDQAALRAVLEARPFPPLPPEFKGQSLRVHFGFEVELRPEQGVSG